MVVRPIHPSEHGELLALMEKSLRPEGGRTLVAEDFPVALDRKNDQGLIVLAGPDGIAAGLACLVRPFRTSLGLVTVAAIGSVVTHPSLRGRGLSSRLQRTILARLATRGVSLAVLWSDHPEWYAGRGFTPAGLENHVDLSCWCPQSQNCSPCLVRAFKPGDESAIGNLYAAHPYITEREPGDAERLYRMPGTQGWVATDDQGEVAAYVFCGKGADFPGYVLEWGGDESYLQNLLLMVREHHLANRILVPQGCDGMLSRLIAQGGETYGVPSGLWCIVSPENLRRQTAEGAQDMSEWVGMHLETPVDWLGQVSATGEIRRGPLQLAVWGFDSV